ncbi:MAG TPA: type II secretion system F family protein [bacterium]|nr:type II secretion system F family protein [bacterium]
MARFTYRAYDRTGRLEVGVMDAETPRVAAATLQSRGYLVSAVSEQGQQPERAMRQLRRLKGVNRRDLVIFTRQLATMISAGLPIVTALRVLEEQASQQQLREVIGGVRAGIERGGSLSSEIAKHPQAFFEFYVNTIRAGEVSGLLDVSLEYLADYLERELDLVQRVRTAATYPLLVLIFTLMVATAAIVLIVPMFVQIFRSFKVALPLITIIMVRVSLAVRSLWWLGLLALVAAGVGLFMLRRTRAGRRTLDSLLLRLPIIGQIIQKLAFARFGRSMAVVIRSGIPLLEGLDAVADSLGNRVIGDAVAAARERMRQGKSMADALDRSSLISPMVVQMIRVGEETGAMETVLNKIAEFYEREVDNTVKRFASIVEPVLIMLVGGVVAIVALAVLLPIWTLIARLPR